MKKIKEVKKIDRRKIPEFFKAVEKHDYPEIYIGKLLSDDGFNIQAFAVNSHEETHVKNRFFEKSKFRFYKIDKHEVEIEFTRAIHHMTNDLNKARFELDAIEYNLNFAKQRSKGLLNDSRT